MSVSSPPTGQDERLAFSVEEAAKKLGIGRTAAYLATQRGEIPTVRIGGRVLVPKAALDRLLAGDEPATGATPTRRSRAA